MSVDFGSRPRCFQKPWPQNTKLRVFTIYAKNFSGRLCFAYENLFDFSNHR